MRPGPSRRLRRRTGTWSISMPSRPLRNTVEIDPAGAFGWTGLRPVRVRHREDFGQRTYLAPEGEDDDARGVAGAELQSRTRADGEGRCAADLRGRSRIIANGIQHAVVLAAGHSEESRSTLRDFVAAIDRVPNAALVAVVHQQSTDDLKSLVPSSRRPTRCCPCAWPPTTAESATGTWCWCPPASRPPWKPAAACNCWMPRASR